MKDTPIFVNSVDTIEETKVEVKQTITNTDNIYDIYIIACHLDPNLEYLRQQTNKIIIGIGEASILYSKILGKRFSIIGSSSTTVQLKTEMVKRYGGERELDMVGYPLETDSSHELRDKLLNASRASVEKHDSKSIVLGCAGFTGVDAYIEQDLGVEVIDGIIISLMIADDYAKYKLYKESLFK